MLMQVRYEQVAVRDALLSTVPVSAVVNDSTKDPNMAASFAKLLHPNIVGDLPWFAGASLGPERFGSVQYQLCGSRDIVLLRLWDVLVTLPGTVDQSQFTTWAKTLHAVQHLTSEQLQEIGQNSTIYYARLEPGQLLVTPMCWVQAEVAHDLGVFFKISLLHGTNPDSDDAWDDFEQMLESSSEKLETEGNTAMRKSIAALLKTAPRPPAASKAA